MKVKFTLHTGYAGCAHEETVNVADDATDDFIEEMWQDWVWDTINGYWDKEEDNK